MNEISETDTRLAAKFGELTDRQRQVLDLLLDHLTSKEIARRLQVSPYTVDQRIQFARKKLGAKSRSELAVEYRRLKAIYGRTVYEESYMAPPAIPLEKGRGSDTDYLISGKRPESIEDREDEKKMSDFQVAPEWFNGRHGTLARIVVIVIIAFILILLGLGGLAIFSSLSELLSS